MFVVVNCLGDVIVAGIQVETCFVTATVLSISRHTVVCRAAQEASAQPREYIDRKKENAIFAPP